MVNYRSKYVPTQFSRSKLILIPVASTFLYLVGSALMDKMNFYGMVPHSLATGLLLTYAYQINLSLSIPGWFMKYILVGSILLFAGNTLLIIFYTKMIFDLT